MTLSWRITGYHCTCLRSMSGLDSQLESGLFCTMIFVIMMLFCYSFGITPTMEKLHHDGTMHTKVDDCQFVCIPQSEYCRILHEVKHQIVCCLHRRNLHVIIKRIINYCNI